ncbi:MAG: thioredoxin-disulfide reductase [Candidatus Nealsonbacteria bacterium CG03_land_8_20_14_0_80_36_12]|uniref:Thioredoxin-disulfide reductase n=1 Tax=Candidatus Nealsonbacteria bacterium CG03_land_8_20_14_0_80_36_12 TaxID=1974701 RepID=A0A2M7BYK0_9BACT|nr:MAG: thioredoxin-disulfide reductase [Candidatus Nealsonbacteria bacterium CG03_land_8_20_14_0_80_36_12]
MVYDLIIIGGGPAGITAGIYAARQKLKTLLITKSFGGQVARKAVAIENYPGFEKISGQELIKKLEEQLRKQKIDIEQKEVIRVEKKAQGFLILTESKETFESKTVIVASGADPRPLEVPGEKKFIGRGLSYCVTCDAPVFSNKTVAVIGGGNAGFEAAIFLANYAKKIYILEAGSKVGADQFNQEKVKKIKKIEVISSAILKRIEGKKFVEKIIYQNKKTKKNITLPLEGIFVEIGSQPATSFIKGLVDFNKKDEIKVDFETCQTKTEGLFAVGDLNVGPYKQIVTAAGEGAKAALAAYDYLSRLEI